jgi:hypothetical protein
MMRTITAGPPWLPYAFPFLFAGVWVGIGWMNSLVGGWRRLAQRYRGRLANAEPTLRPASATFALLLPASYGHAVRVGVGAAGIGLSVHWAFVIGNPPLLIPWEELVECRSWRLLGLFDRFSFVVADTGVRVTITGAAGRSLESEVLRRDPTRAILTGSPQLW